MPSARFICSRMRCKRTTSWVPVFSLRSFKNISASPRSFSRCFASCWQISITSCGNSPIAKRCSASWVAGRYRLRMLFSEAMRPYTSSQCSLNRSGTASGGVVFGRNCSMQVATSLQNRSSCRRNHGAVISALISSASRATSGR